MSYVLDLARLVDDAKFEVEIAAKCVIKAKMNADFNPTSWNQDMLKSHLNGLAEAENRLKLFTEAYEKWQNEKPELLKWALGE